MGLGIIDFAGNGASANPATKGTDPSVLASAATGLVKFIERQRGDVDRIFGSAGISPEMAGSPTLQLSLNSYCRLFEESARLTASGLATHSIPVISVFGATPRSPRPLSLSLLKPLSNFSRSTSSPRQWR